MLHFALSLLLLSLHLGFLLQFPFFFLHLLFVHGVDDGQFLLHFLIVLLDLLQSLSPLIHISVIVVESGPQVILGSLELFPPLHFLIPVLVGEFVKDLLLFLGFLIQLFNPRVVSFLIVFEGFLVSLVDLRLFYRFMGSFIA